MNEIVVLAGADTEMLRKYVELDEQDEARADAFERDVQEALDLISRHPLIGFGHLYPPYRKWSLRGWNMAIIYQPSGRRCFIHAVLDMRQNPQSIRAILPCRTPPGLNPADSSPIQTAPTHVQSRLPLHPPPRSHR